jgi:hypothetical protein
MFCTVKSISNWTVALNRNDLFIWTFSGCKTVVGTNVQSPHCLEVEMFLLILFIPSHGL